MKSRISMPLLAVSLLTGLAMTVPIVAQEQSTIKQQNPNTAHYKISDLGTLQGGTFSQPFYINNNLGLVSGSSATADGNQHAVLWLQELKLDIGVPGLGGPNSIAFRDNETLQASGEAETSTPDPNGEDFCGFGTHLTCLPFLWQDGHMTALATLGGNNGVAKAINDLGVVAGYAENSTPIPTAQLRKFFSLSLSSGNKASFTNCLRSRATPRVSPMRSTIVARLSAGRACALRSTKISSIACCRFMPCYGKKAP